VSEIEARLAETDDVRSIQRRRNCDETTIRLALELTERGSVWLARDQSEVIGIAVAHDSERERYVGDLFVEPSYRGQGIGTKLLDAALRGSGDVRSMLVDPRDAAAVALTIRHGLRPLESTARLTGAIPREEQLAALAAGDYRFEVDAIDPAAHGFALNALDRASRGSTRISDHSEFARAATGLAFFLDGEFVAYAYVWPDGRVGPLASASTAYLVQILGYALVTLQRRYRASWCTLLIPGSNLRVARAASRAGLRIQETLMIASDSSAWDMSAYVGYHPLLY
jgi:GNAT superfamily N-acetyltransferase